ncbi:hypothetical protein DRQ09_06595, partial [candidate division KSB1 bacterium]
MQKYTVLIVEDEYNLRHIYSMALRRYGYKVLTAPNANEALKTFSKENIDLLVTDIKMPGKDGLVLVKQFRRMAKYRDTPVIVLSAYGTKSAVERGIELGIQSFLAKPCSLDELSLCVFKFLNMKKSNGKENNNNHFTILLYDDNLKTTDIIFEFLNEHFYNVLLANNFDDAVNYINNFNINCIV